MILFIILLIMLLILALFGIVAFGAGGTVFAILFGDVIACVLLIVWLVKRTIIKRKK